MTLAKYKSKRHFKDTPEPPPVKKKTGEKDLIFTVQKHAARRLHYDFRIECDGVLKSWAVPKGPSLNPADKRLAIMVEDHPYDYHSFEGIIPKGNYGAGTVMLWDEGTYNVSEEPLSRKKSEAIVRKGLEKGHLDLFLHGHKLKGQFTLVRMHGDENQWLLFKKKDSYATKIPVNILEKSVSSDRSMDEIAGKSNDYLLKDTPKSKMPLKVTPMLSVLVAQPFNRPDWFFEIKWDGYRAIAFMKKKDVKLLSRNEKSFTAMFPEVIDDLKDLQLNAVIDGEVVILDESGKPQFQLLQNFQTTKKGMPFYYVFDLLYLNGHDLRELPLRNRKEILKELISTSKSRVRYCDHIENQGIAFFEKVSKMNLEGIMAKDANSPYVMRRSNYWEKIKTHQRQEVVVGGFSAPQGSRKKFGALLVGVYKDKKLLYSGHVGGGFNQKTLNEVYALLEPLIVEKSPFSTKFRVNAPVTWIKPKIVCEVAFAEWTSEGIMRQPIFKGVRLDKNPKSVAREISQAEL